MFTYYKLEIISIILDIFKVTDVVIGSLSDKKIINQILEYCNNSNSTYVAIDSSDVFQDNINEPVIKVLPYLNNYGAIFLDDDPNWYTLYNELNIIKNNNNEFPLVFICNNNFPHERRDSYSNPDCIPAEFRNEYSEKLIYKEISIKDGFYHSIKENTPKNGVLTAIEDFLSENPSIDIMDIKLSNGITILYPKNNITYFRLQNLSKKIQSYAFEYDSISENFVENQLLVDYISNLHISQDSIDVINQLEDIISKKEEVINSFQDKTKIYQSEVDYKNTQINRINSKLNLKESQIKNIESKLLNKDFEIENLKVDFQDALNQIEYLKEELIKKDEIIKNNNQNHENELSSMFYKIDSLKKDISKKGDYELELINELKRSKIDVEERKNQIQLKQKEINDKVMQLNLIKKQITYNLSKIDEKEYCINCYKEKLNDNFFEINYLKKRSFIKKFFIPFEYIYLIFNSKPSQLSLNYKLYKLLKNSQCFDIGFYLNNNKDLRNSRFCNYFSPELHYVCKGFDEKRKFNKKYFNRNTKNDLLEYIIKCS